MAHAQTSLAAVESKGRDLLVYHGGKFNWIFKPTRSKQGDEALLIINQVTRARGSGGTKAAAMEAAAAKLVWTETENMVHSLGRLPLLAPAPKAKSEHLGLLHQHFRKEQLHWLPSLQVYRPKNHRGSGNDENSWVTSWVVVLAVTCEFGTKYHRGEGSGERAASYEAARVTLHWYADEESKCNKSV